MESKFNIPTEKIPENNTNNAYCIEFRGIKCETEDCDNISNEKQNDSEKHKILIKEDNKPCPKDEDVQFNTKIIHKEIQEENITIDTNNDSICDESFNTEHNGLNAIEFVEATLVKEETEESELEKCKETFSFPNYFDPIAAKEDIFTCNYCTGAFTTLEFCQMHEKRCKINIQEQQSTSADEKEFHKEKLYQCDQCSDKFKSKSGLRSHRRRHNGINLHTCSVCTKQFISPSSLATHMLTHGGKKHVCPFCNGQYTTPNSLKKHMILHTGESAHKCNECNKAFSGSWQLTEHMRTHNGESPYKCIHCDKTYSSSSSLRLHMMSHTGEKPYKCSECDMSFILSCYLARHMRSHTGVRPYKCTQCDKVYSQSVHLRKHMKLHTG